MEYLKLDSLRTELLKVLCVQTRNQVVKDIQSRGRKFHQFQIDKFLRGEDVKLSTLEKIQEFIEKAKL